MDILSFELGKKLGGDSPGPGPGPGEYIEDGAVAIHENKSWETADLYQYISGTLGLPPIDTSTGFTVEARVAPTQPTQNYPSFFSLDGSGSRVLLGLSTSESEKDASSDFGIVAWGWNGDIIFKPENLNYGDWHTFSFTANTTAVKLYIDGQLFETKAAVTGTVTPTSISQMYYPNMTRYAKGKWGCTRWYNRVLTVDEIAANYAIDAGKYDET